MKTVLATRDLVAGYQPDLPILRSVDLRVAQGEFVVLLGPNGAGKSTLVKAMAGLVPIHAGRIELEGRDITALPAHRRLSQGMAFVPQTENIFARMSIRENLQLAAQILPRSDRANRIAAMMDLFPELAARQRSLAGALSGGQRQMLAVARALIVEPEILILDEPSAGLSPLMVTEVFARLSAIHATGITIVLVEQNVRVGLGVASRGIVLVEGRIAHDASSAALADDPVVAQLYLGGRAGEVTA